MVTKETELNDMNQFLRVIGTEEDILNNILRKLSEETTISLGYTCKKCRRIFEEFHVWKSSNIPHLH